MRHIESSVGFRKQLKLMLRRTLNDYNEIIAITFRGSYDQYHCAKFG